MTSSVLLAAIGILTVVLLYAKKFYDSTFNYWNHRDIPYIPSTSVFGNIRDVALYKNCPAIVLKELYDDEKTKTEPITGIRIVHKPGLLIRDLDLIKQILIKDFNRFSNRYAASDPHSDTLGGYNLFFVKNPLWREIRTKITPIFTSGKMKQFFLLVNDIGKNLDSYLNSSTLAEKSNTVCKELKEICAIYTTDVIASTAYGIEANSMKNPDSEFRKNGRAIFNFTLWRSFEFSSFFFLPQIVSLFKNKVFSQSSSKFLRSTFNHIISEREKTKTCRNDLIDNLLAIKKSSKLRINGVDVKMEGDILVAQAAVFFAAGFETTSATMSFGLYELSKAPEIQMRLRKEIRNVLIENQGDISYDIIMNMEYLQMVVQEILRLYPPVPFLDRECESVDGSSEGYSLAPTSDFVVPNTMPIYIPIYAIHRDEKYFPNPDKFDPERFSRDNKDQIIPYSYLPFGTGPRVCIGERFALMQTKVGLFYFLKNHVVKISPKTHKTMRLEKKALVIQSEGGIYCDIVRDPLVK